MEPDSVLGASTAHGTLKGRAKMDAMNKSHRSGLYSTIGRNAKMPEEDEDEEEESKHERSRRSQKPGKKNTFRYLRENTRRTRVWPFLTENSIFMGIFDQFHSENVFRSLSISTFVSQVSSVRTNRSVRKDRNVSKNGRVSKNRLLCPQWCRPVNENWTLRRWRYQFQLVQSKESRAIT